MSATVHAHDDHGAAVEGHDAHAHDDDHGEPPPPEPASPAWLPLLGCALFLLAFLVYLFTSADEGGANAARATAEAAAADAKAKAEAKPEAKPEPVRAARRPMPGMPGMGGAGTAGAMDPNMRVLPRMARPPGSIPGVNMAASGRIPSSPGEPPRPMRRRPSEPAFAAPPPAPAPPAAP